MLARANGRLHWLHGVKTSVVVGLVVCDNTDVLGVDRQRRLFRRDKKTGMRDKVHCSTHERNMYLWDRGSLQQTQSIGSAVAARSRSSCPSQHRATMQSHLTLSPAPFLRKSVARIQMSAPPCHRYLVCGTRSRTLYACCVRCNSSALATLDYARLCCHHTAVSRARSSATGVASKDRRSAQMRPGLFSIGMFL
jgi:hypothetical protein